MYVKTCACASFSKVSGRMWKKATPSRAPEAKPINKNGARFRTLSFTAMEKAPIREIELTASTATRTGMSPTRPQAALVTEPLRKAAILRLSPGTCPAPTTQAILASVEVRRATILSAIHASRSSTSTS